MASPGTRVGPVTLPAPSYAFVVPALGAVGGAVFLAAKPGVARSMIGSPQAAAFTLVIGGLVLGAGWLLPRLGSRPATTMAVQAVPVVIAFVLTVLPAFRQVTVLEPFPAVDAASGQTSGAATGAAGRATVLGRADISGIDHRATGQALLLQRADGTLVVRLQDIDIEPGPDYQVHLVVGGGREKPDGGVHLDGLRGNRGSHNYDVPDDFRPGLPVTVLVWCRAFAVPIAAATLR